MLSRFLRHLLFNLVHLALTILVAVKNVQRRFVTRKSQLSMKEVSKGDIKMILEHKPQLKKQLHHLVMLSDTDHHSLSDLAFIVIWSLIAGVPYVSFYDVTGKYLNRYLLTSKQSFFTFMLQYISWDIFR